MAEWIIDDDFLEEEIKMSAESQGHLHRLIRCKDCALFRKTGCPLAVFKDLPNENDYCNYGKLKSD